MAMSWRSRSVLAMVTLAVQVFVDIAGCYEIRLAGGATRNEGRLEVLHNGKWGVVCASSQDELTQGTGTVVCRQLKYPPFQNQRMAPESLMPSANATAVLGDVRCDGFEPNLESCFVQQPVGSAACRANESVQIKCTGTPLIPSLVNGTSRYSGRVQLNDSAIPNYACGAFFGMNEAEVFCRQLNFGPPIQVFNPGHFGPGDGIERYKRLLCFGSEDNLGYCRSKSAFADSYCGASKAAAIQCSVPPDTGVPITIRSQGPPATTPTTPGSTVGCIGGTQVQDKDWGGDNRTIGLIVGLAIAAVVMVAAIVVLVVFIVQRKT